MPFLRCHSVAGQLADAGGCLQWSCHPHSHGLQGRFRRVARPDPSDISGLAVLIPDSSRHQASIAARRPDPQGGRATEPAAAARAR